MKAEENSQSILRLDAARPLREAGGAGGLWSAGALLIAALVVLPIVSVLVLAFHPTENIWPHLLATTLPRYVANTLVLTL